MGLRKDILVAITETLDGLPIGDRALTVVNTLFDGGATAREYLPKFACVPSVEQIQVGLSGRAMDSTLRITLFGFSNYSEKAGETLFGVAEDIIEAIIQRLTDVTIVSYFNNDINFAITEIGPVLCEQMDEAAQLAYISIPLATVLVEN